MFNPRFSEKPIFTLLICCHTTLRLRFLRRVRSNDTPPRLRTPALLSSDYLKFSVSLTLILQTKSPVSLLKFFSRTIVYDKWFTTIGPNFVVVVWFRFPPLIRLWFRFLPVTFIFFFLVKKSRVLPYRNEDTDKWTFHWVLVTSGGFLCFIGPDTGVMVSCVSNKSLSRPIKDSL